MDKLIRDLEHAIANGYSDNEIWNIRDDIRRMSDDLDMQSLVGYTGPGATDRPQKEDK